jgi:hypothetical protein
MTVKPVQADRHAAPGSGCIKESQDISEMSKLLTGLLGTLWGGGLLYYWVWAKAGFSPVGIFLGAFIFAGGAWYLYLWWRERQAKRQS